MISKDKYKKYRAKYLESKKTINNINFVIIDTIRGDDTKYMPELKIRLNGKVYKYKFKFKNNRYTLKDLTFESANEDIKKFIDEKKLTNIIFICLEESSPYGLYFVDKYPDYCKAIICYPLRLNTKESLDRLYYKYIEKKGWKSISTTYDPIDYFFEINDKRLNELFEKNGDEEKTIIELITNLQLRKQCDKIPKKFKCQTYLFSRLDMDAVSLIKYNFDRKEIAAMKGILSPDDAIYNSMMWNIARVQYDNELLDLNKETGLLRIHYMIALEINEDIRLITDAVKILT